jgi:uncharacterized membrane protein
MRKRLTSILLLLFAVLWIGGVVTYSLGGSTIGPEGWTAPAFLWTAALLSLLNLDRPHALSLAAAGILAFFAEYVGVSTGFPFGAYVYTSTLGFKLLGVPVAITMAWIVLLGYVWTGTSRLSSGPVVRAAISAFWMTAIDLVVDPLAAGPLSYWRWIDGGIYFGIPFTNFLGWFSVSFVLLTFLHRKRAVALVPSAVGLSVLLFFTILAAAQAMIVPAFVGAILIVLDFGLLRRHWIESAVLLKSCRSIFVRLPLLLIAILATQQALSASDVPHLIITAKKLLREGSAQNDTAAVGKARSILQSAHAQSESPETQYFLAQAEYELVRLGVAEERSGLYDRYIDSAIEKVKALIRDREQWSEGHALYSSLLGYRIAHNPLNAFSSGPKAYSSAEKAVELDSTNPRAWLVRGIVKLNTPSWFGGDKREALKSLHRSVELYEQRTTHEWQDPEWGYLDALVWTGWSYEKNDRPEEARTWYLKALRFEPRADWIHRHFLEPLEQRIGTN